MAALLGTAAVGVTASEQGAYFPAAWGWSAVGLLLAAALGLAFRSRVEVTRLQWAFLGGLTLVLLWTVLSTVWSVSLPRSVDEVERTIVYVAGIAALIAVASAETVRYTLAGVLAAVVGIAGYSLWERLLGHGAGGPLTGPLGYWNALGILAAIGLLLAVGFASADQPMAFRLLALLTVPLLATTIYLTHSRGALFGLGAGLLVFAFWHPWLSERRRRMAVASIAVIALAALGIGLARTGGPSALLGRTYRAFRAPPAPHGRRSERLLTISGNFRSHYWKVAWNEFLNHPWLGSGAGTFDLYWDRDRKTIYGARDAHNLYLETAAELGSAGLALLGATLAIPLLALRRAPRGPLTAAAAGAYVAFLLHAAVDWDWELPAVTLAGLLCGGSLTALARGRAISPRMRWSVLTALTILAAFTAVAWRGNSAADASAHAADRARYHRAESEARTATRWTPWSSSAWRLLGEAQLGLGQVRHARHSFRVAIEKDPRDWTSWYDLALSYTGAARREALRRAALLDPYALPLFGLRTK